MLDINQSLEIYGAILPIAILMINNEDDQRFIAEIYLEHKLLIYKVARPFFKRPEDIEDAIQETAKRLCSYAEKLKGVERHKIKNYIVIICRRVCIDILKRMAKESSRRIYFTDGESFESFADNEPDMHTLVFDKVHAKDMLHGFSQLNEEYKEYILMRYVDQLDYSEIAKAYGVTEDTARKRVSRARQKLEKLAQTRKESEEA